MNITEQLCTAYDFNRGGPPNSTGRVSREAVLEYIDAHSVEHPPSHPTTALHWDLIRTFGASEGRRLLLRASRQWDAKPLRARDIVFKWSILEDDYEPQAWVDEYLADVIHDWRAERDRLRLCAEAEKAWSGFNGFATPQQMDEWNEKYGAWVLSPHRKFGKVTVTNNVYRLPVPPPSESLRVAAQAELDAFMGVVTQKESDAWFEKYRSVAHEMARTNITIANDKVVERDRREAIDTSDRVDARRFDAASLHGKAVPDREWLVPGLIPAGNVTLLYGDGGTGKSLLALQLAATKVRGGMFFGRPLKAGKCEFFTAEDSRDEIHRRLVDIARMEHFPLSELGGLSVTSLVDTDALLATEGGDGLTETPLYRKLESILAENRPDLLVLDTLADVFGGNEVVRAQARRFVAMLRKLCLFYGCTVVVLAHPSLSGMDKGTSGSTGWNNSVRSRLFFARVLDTDGTEPDEDARVLRVGKLNYGRVGTEIPMRWKSGAFVGEGDTSGPDPLTQRWKAEQVFLELLDKANKHHAHVSSKKGANYAPAVFAREALKQGVKKRDLVDVMNHMLDSGKIENTPHGSPSRMRYWLERVAQPPAPSVFPPSLPPSFPPSLPPSST
ncbi:AAA family ATPase [Bradyrhizobium ottawaense]|uniref:AAA family ATPase n=1 Tax=Bradyrhizobium ottawaense TaxID=931866 RepID=UPI001BAD0775|nr:AAA family ATPase [Bradyrhizobium ottawaense]MBR1362924.1 AAA family ATPase [Bradyrhizobium ottawaense]